MFLKVSLYQDFCMEKRIHRKINQDLCLIRAHNVNNVIRKLNIGHMKGSKKGYDIKHMVEKRFLENIIPKGTYKNRIYIYIKQNMKNLGEESPLGEDLAQLVILSFLSSITTSEDWIFFKKKIEKMVMDLLLSYFFKANRKHSYLPINL